MIEKDDIYMTQEEKAIVYTKKVDKQRKRIIIFNFILSIAAILISIMVLIVRILK